MKIEQAPQVMVHCWHLPPGLSRDEAITYFREKVKPRDYTFERFWYNPRTGKTSTL